MSPVALGGDRVVGGGEEVGIRVVENGGFGQTVKDDEAEAVGSGLLVDPHGAQQVRPGRSWVAHRQAERAEDGRVPGGGFVIEASGEPAELRGEDEADADRGSVPPAVPLAALDGVPEGVAVVEHLPAPGLSEILGNH